jgi:lipid A 3-O-deacylase
MKYFYCINLLIISLIGFNTANAQTYRNQIGGRLENDQYINPYNDRYYMAGTMLNYTTILKHTGDNTGLMKKTLEIEIGQHIYGPFATYARKIKMQDRPYTGYLYAGGSMNWLYANESALKVTVQVGTIGPASGAEKIQKGFHDIFGLKEPEGWQYQLKNEVGLNIEANYKQLLYRNSKNWLDVSIDPSVRIGNTFSNATAAVMLRAGKLGKLYESASTNSRVSLKDEEQGGELFFYAIPQLSYVAYNATIQGGLFRDDKGPVTFDIYNLVFTQQLGVQFATRRWSASYTAFIRTREVKSTALGDQWGVLALAYRFGKN